MNKAYKNLYFAKKNYYKFCCIFHKEGTSKLPLFKYIDLASSFRHTGKMRQNTNVLYCWLKYKWTVHISTPWLKYKWTNYCTHIYTCWLKYKCTYYCTHIYTCWLKWLPCWGLPPSGTRTNRSGSKRVNLSSLDQTSTK